MILLSVIIPVFNSEKYLQNTLDSILSQDVADMELVCVNDGSTDSSLEILEEYASKDGRIHVISQENRGAGVSRNVGFENSSGKYIHFMDSDDWLEPGAYRTILERMERTSVDICVFQRIIYNNVTGESNLQTRAFDIDNYITDFESNPVFFTHSPVVPWNKLIRSSLIRDNGLRFDDLPCANDRSFYFASVRCAKSIMVCKDPLIHYRVNNSKSLIGYTRSIHFDAHFKSYYSTMEYYKDADKTVRMMVTDAAMVDMDRFFRSANIYYKIRIYFQLHDFLKNIDFSDFYKNPQRYPWVHPLGFVRKYRFGFPLYFYRIHKQYVKKHPRKSDSTTTPISNSTPAPELIVSFTSYPERIPTIHRMLESVFEQTISPGKIILWLSEDQFPGKEADLPISLLSYRDRGLKIRFVPDDLKPHKKYYYAMQEFPDRPIVTLDDDVIYPGDTLSKLWESYQLFPHAVSAIRAHRIAITDGRIGKYSEWIQNEPMFFRRPSMLAFATGVGGVLYPPGFMPPIAFDKQLINDYCLLGDDIWLKCMEILSDTPTVSADIDAAFTYVEGTQDTALWKNNQSKGYNDAYFSDIATALENKGFESLERKISSSLMMRKKKLALLVGCGRGFDTDTLVKVDSSINGNIRIIAYDLSDSDIEKLHARSLKRTVLIRNNKQCPLTIHSLTRYSGSDWIILCDLFNTDYSQEAIDLLNAMDTDFESMLNSSRLYEALGINRPAAGFDPRCVPVPSETIIESGLSHIGDSFSQSIIISLCSATPSLLDVSDANQSLYSESDWEKIRYLARAGSIRIKESDDPLSRYLTYNDDDPPENAGYAAEHRLHYKLCPICHSLSSHFLISGTSLRDNVMCPTCKSYERHRALIMITNGLFESDREFTYVNFPKDMKSLLGDDAHTCGLYQLSEVKPIDVACICYAIHSKDDLEMLFGSVRGNLSENGALVISMPLKNVHGSVPLAYELDMDIFALRDYFNREDFDLDIYCVNDLFDMHVIDDYGLNKKEIIFVAKQTKSRQSI